MAQSDNSQIVFWMEQAVANLGEHSEETLKYCSQILSYGEQTKSDMYLGFAHYYSGEAYYTLNNVELVLLHISQALGYLERAGVWELVARAYNLTAITSIAIGNAAFAMDYYVQALSCCRKHELIYFENTVLINMGMLYYSYGEYERAKRYFLDSLRFLEQHTQMDEYYLCTAVDHIGLGRCALHTGEIESAQWHEKQIREICATHIDATNYSYLTFQSELYHASGEVEKRDACITCIRNILDGQIRIMDYFEDFYEYALLLMTIDREKEFLELTKRLEELAAQAKITNLQRRVCELKIKYFKRIGDTDAYLREAAGFYENTVRMERSNQAMMLAMMDTCRVLQEEREEKSQIVTQNEKLTQKSETDALTGLANRFRLDRHSLQQFERAVSDGLPIAVEILDIDYFKQYNDNYGHQKGDQCICMIADELKRISRQEGVSVYRYGGDEFVVIYLGLQKERVSEIVEELRQGIASRCLEHAYSLVADVVTVSQGICWGYPTHPRMMADFLKTADASLYKVKKVSRGSKLVTEYPGSV